MKMEYEDSLMVSISKPDTSNADKQQATPASRLSGVALVVDDEKNVLKACAAMVKHCGFSVITACDGVDALSKFSEHGDEIDVVVMDLSMPNLDGISAMIEMLYVRPDVKVILSSGYDEQALKERFVEHRPSGFIRKPYFMKDLEAELRRVMLKDNAP